MKVSKQQASDNREAIVQEAARQVRELGFSQMSVAEVAKAAGLTHGALYSHFKSKEALQAAAIERAFHDCTAEFAGLSADQFLAHYLSPQHRDNAGHGCPTAALVSEMRWQSAEARAAFHDGVNRYVAVAADSLGRDTARGQPDLTMLAFAAMAGGLAISRALRGVDEAASDAVLRSVADQLRQVGIGGASPDSARTPDAAYPAAKPRARRKV